MNIKYPNNKKPSKSFKTIKSRGLLLENAINLSNEFYLHNNKAVIYKKPTPIQVVKVDYPKRAQAKITEAYYQSKSTTDYNGIYREKYIDFEAKETAKLSFDFANIHPHQIEHLYKTHQHGGISFILIYFRKVQETYLIDIMDFYKLYTQGKKGGKKSITLEEVKTIGFFVENSYAPPIDYLTTVDKVYFA